MIGSNRFFSPRNSAGLGGTPVLVLATLLQGVLSFPALGNDGYGELGLGGIVALGKTSSVFMAKEVLEVSTKAIRVDYVFERRSLKYDGVIQMLFPLPLYSADQPTWSWAGAPRDFSVTVDGKPQPFRSVVKARVGRCENGIENRQCGHDVTKTLQAAGLSDTQIALYPNASPFMPGKDGVPKVPGLTDSQKQTLRQGSLLNKVGPSGEQDYPTWLADVSYLWELAFNDRKQVEVSHQYVPFTSGGSGSIVDDEDTMRNDYCADDQLVEAWKKLRSTLTPPEKLFSEAVPARRVEYILTTANSWGGPIGDFTLRLKKGKPSEVVMLCFPGKVRKVDPLTLEIRLKNFKPLNELRVLFLNVEDVSGPSGVAPRISK